MHAATATAIGSALAVEHCDTLAALEDERALRFDRLAAVHEQLATKELEP